MGSIAGALALDGHRARFACAQLMQALNHRIPTGMRVVETEPAIVALACGSVRGVQSGPAAVELSGGGLLIADARIDNVAPLLRQLGPAPDGRVDPAAVLALAWARWREDLWRHVIGDYALVVWEAAEGRLSLVRDRAGVRPLYWARTPGLFAFASEPEALLTLPGVSAQPDPDRLADWLVPGFVVEDRAITAYRDVRRVLPGTTVTMMRDGRFAERTWHVFEPGESLDLKHPNAYAEALGQTLDAAIRDSAATPGTPSLMLSGGIDSASVHAGALRQALPLRRISVVTAAAWGDGERDNIQQMLAQSADTRMLDVDRLQESPAIDALVSEVFEHAHPIRNSILLPMLVAQAAAASGSAVLLDGIDGDLVMHTPDDYPGRLALQGRWGDAWRESRRAARHNTYLRSRTALGILARGLASRLQPDAVAAARLRLRGRRLDLHASGGMLHPSLVTALRLPQRMLEHDLRLRESGVLRDWPRYLARSWTYPGLMRGMEGFDLAAARFGVEARHPWCDTRVLDLFMRLPLDVVVHDGWTKWIARQAYAPELGEVAWHSQKRHFGPAVTRALLRAGADHVDDALKDGQGVLDGIVDPVAVAAARSDWAMHREDAEDIDRIMTVVTMQRWLTGLAAAG